MTGVYQLLNIFFFIFHTVLIFFNTLGWMFPATRRWNLITLGATAFSWFVMGIWYGWGYCFCTDWHWAVRRKLGFHDESHSYIHFLVLQLTGKNVSVRLTETVTLIVFLISIVVSVWLNIRDYQRRKINYTSRS